MDYKEVHCYSKMVIMVLFLQLTSALHASDILFFSWDHMYTNRTRIEDKHLFLSLSITD